MKKSRGILVLILTAIVTVFFCYTAAVGIGPTGTGAMKNIKTGLDLAGGVSITYQAKASNPSSEDMSDTVYKPVSYTHLGIHITICVNYNQHMAATTRERYIKGAERKMTILLWLWRLEEFCLKTELMFYIQELQMITFLLLSGQGWQMRQKWIFLSLFTGTAALR